MRALECSSKLEKRSAVGCCNGTIAGQRDIRRFRECSAPCCGVPVRTEGKGDEVPQTFLRRESSSFLRSRRATRSASSACDCCTRSISVWKRQKSSRGWKAMLSGSIPGPKHPLVDVLGGGSCLPLQPSVAEAQTHHGAVNCCEPPLGYLESVFSIMAAGSFLRRGRRKLCLRRAICEMGQCGIGVKSLALDEMILSQKRDSVVWMGETRI